MRVVIRHVQNKGAENKLAKGPNPLRSTGPAARDVQWGAWVWVRLVLWDS